MLIRRPGKARILHFPLLTNRHSDVLERIANLREISPKALNAHQTTNKMPEVVFIEYVLEQTLKLVLLLWACQDLSHVLRR